MPFGGNILEEHDPVSPEGTLSRVLTGFRKQRISSQYVR